MVYAKYKNSAFEPKVHDFGDSYHLPDAYDEENDSIIAKVKMIRKRYTDWFMYQDAIELYDRYIENLYEKYGGKKKFKLAMLLGQVKDYIPNYPELRRTKRNRYFIDNKVSSNIVLGEPTFEPSPIEDKPVKIKVDIGDNKSSKVIQTLYNDIQKRKKFDNQEIVEEMDILDRYWHNQHKKSENLKRKDKKKKVKKLLRKKIEFQALTYRSLTDKVNLYDKAKRDKFMGIERGIQERFVYKDAVYTARENEDMIVFEKLKALGIKPSKLSKNQMKVVRASKKQEKKKRKLERKNLKAERHFMSDFTNGQFEDFQTFEDGVLNNLTGSRRFS